MKLCVALLFFLLAWVFAEENNFKNRDDSNLVDSAKIFKIEPDGNRNQNCSLEMHLGWESEVGSSVFNTPTIGYFLPDGHKQIVVATHSKYVEIIEHDGYKPFGWPITFENSEFHTTPIPFDIDGNGYDDLVLCDNHGSIFWVQLSEQGRYLHNFHSRVPRLEVKKDWFAGLDLDNLDTHVKLPYTKGYDKKKFKTREDAKANEKNLEPTKTKTGDEKVAPTITEPTSLGGTSKVDNKHGEYSSMTMKSLRERFYELFEELHGVKVDANTIDTVENMDREQLMEWFDFFEEMLTEPFSRRPIVDDNTILLDPHVMTTPVVVDLERDGRFELLVAVSYYFDPDEYLSEEFDDVKLSSYVAGAVVAFDVKTGIHLWSAHLDMTSAGNDHKPFMYSTPTVADLDGADDTEGRAMKEIIVGTSLGFIYVLDGKTGHTRKGFPVEMDSIEAQIVVEDLTGDGSLEIIAVDVSGNIAVFDKNGKELWEKHLGGYISQKPALGDVNGDGQLDIVVASGNGKVFALNAKNGSSLKGFPVQTDGDILNAPTLVALQTDLKIPKMGLDIIVASTKGGINVISPQGNGEHCYSHYDIGEHVFTQVLVDDLDEDGYLEFIFVTLPGTVMNFRTNAHMTSSLNTWKSSMRGEAVFTAGNYGTGIEILEYSIPKIRLDAEPKRYHNPNTKVIETRYFPFTEMTVRLRIRIYDRFEDGVFGIQAGYAGARPPIQFVNGTGEHTLEYNMKTYHEISKILPDMVVPLWVKMKNDNYQVYKDEVALHIPQPPEVRLMKFALLFLLAVIALFVSHALSGSGSFLPV
eukprot:TRINITY_DN773087_c0_g1_i1.p1 TRINITY_DN773087_c0_g1~~TRINITY_DN773087_c0_g1_i1.p1  ORF type:complete len:807 (+),score=263.55 TRINITY_DN773087_c0_g1_i1:55-2475(+)